MKTESLISGSRHLIKQSMRFIVVLVLAMGCSSCSTSLQTRVSGNLGKLSSLQTVAILPVGVNSNRQMEMARMFRQNLYAQLLSPSKFCLLEPYVVDGLLKQNGLMDPSEYPQLDPIKFGEILGVDAVLISRINKLEKSYYLIHSSIELSASAQLIDTRSGEILWQAEQTEMDIQGILKIPTGMTAAVIAPIYLMINKLKIREMTSKMVTKLTSIVRHPDEVNDEKVFDELEIASAWNKEEVEKESGGVYLAQAGRRDYEKDAQTLSVMPLVPLTDWGKHLVPSIAKITKHVNVEKESGLELKPQVITLSKKGAPSI
jgi:hypothetical protein